MSEPVLQNFQGNTEVDSGAVSLHDPPVVSFQNRTPSTCDHCGFLFFHFAYRLRLPFAKTGLALNGKDLGDRALSLLGDDFIRVVEREVELSGQYRAQSTFPGAR